MSSCAQSRAEGQRDQGTWMITKGKGREGACGEVDLLSKGKTALRTQHFTGRTEMGGILSPSSPRQQAELPSCW